MLLSRGCCSLLEGTKGAWNFLFYHTTVFLLLAQNIIVLWSSPNRKILYISNFTCRWYHFHSPLNLLLCECIMGTSMWPSTGLACEQTRQAWSLWSGLLGAGKASRRLSKCSWHCSQKRVSRKCVETGYRVSVGLPVPLMPREVTIICGSTILGQWDEVWV